MARSRIIRPSFFTSFKLAKLSRDARLFFTGLWVEADDEGRVVDSPRLLAASIYPHDEDVTCGMVVGWIDELEQIGSVVRYECDGGRYLHITGLVKHSKPPHPTPSKLPPPTVSQIRETLANDSRTSPESVANSSRNDRAYVSVSVSDYVPVSVSEPGAVENRDRLTPRDDETETTPVSPRDEMIFRIAALCRGNNRLRVLKEAGQVVTWACKHVDERVINEAIGWFTGKDPPDLPRAVAAVIYSKARDAHVPGLVPFQPYTEPRARTA